VYSKQSVVNNLWLKVC